MFVAIGFIIGLAMGIAYLIHRDNKRFEVWLEEFTKIKKAETAEFIRRLENQ